MRWFEQQRMNWLGDRRAPFNRSDLMDKFGISPAQATNDIRKFQSFRPDTWRYNVRKQKYERAKP